MIPAALTAAAFAWSLTGPGADLLTDVITERNEG